MLTKISATHPAPKSGSVGKLIVSSHCEKTNQAIPTCVQGADEPHPFCHGEE